MSHPSRLREALIRVLPRALAITAGIHMDSHVSVRRKMGVRILYKIPQPVHIFGTTPTGNIIHGLISCVVSAC